MVLYYRQYTIFWRHESRHNGKCAFAASFLWYSPNGGGEKNQGNAMVQTPPKIPEVVLEAKKAMQAEIHDIITKKRSQNEEQADNKTVLELMRRLDVQQKEIEKSAQRRNRC